MISVYYSCESTDWVFIPEHASHFGDISKAAVKSFKTHLARVADNVKLTLEVMTTIAIQIEAK